MSAHVRAPRPGAVEGVVTDAATGEPLVGAAVRLVGTTVGDATDLDGRYRIPSAPAGEADVVATYVGYEPDTARVAVPDGGAVTQDFALRLATVEGGGVVVTAQAEGQLAAINQQLQANQIVNVVSEARIRELPDANAAESVGRLPGVSIQRNAGEGEKVVVRGLAPQYTNVTVNGQRLSATSDDRSTNLTTISPELLSGIEVYKALTPDQDADAIGGTVNFRLREAPAGFQSRLAAQTGHNALDGFGQYRLSGSASDRFLGDRLGLIATANVESVPRNSQSLRADYDRQGEDLETGVANIVLDDVTLRDGVEDRDRFGGSLILDYRLPGGSVQFSNFASRLSRDRLSRDTDYVLSDRRVGYQVEETESTLDVVSNALLGEHVLPAGFEADWNLNHSYSRNRTPYSARLEFQENAAFEEGLDPEAGPEVLTRSALRRLDETALYWGRYSTGRNAERTLGASADLTAPPVRLGTWAAAEVKAGAKVRTVDRERAGTGQALPFYYGEGDDLLVEAFPDVPFVRTPTGFLGLTPFLDPDYDASGFLGGEYPFGYGPDAAFVRSVYDRLASAYLVDAAAAISDYESSERVAAGYVMAELTAGPVTVIPGVRYEHTAADYVAAASVLTSIEDSDVTPTEASQSYGEWFPMVHLRVRPTDWFDVRLARTRTLSRPSFFEALPRSVTRPGGRSIVRGDPALRPAIATGYDAVLSFNGNRVGLFTVGGFYKEIDDVIYTSRLTVLDPEEFGVPASAQGYRLVQPVNNETTTTVRGVELDWQTVLSYLPGPLSGIVLNANYTYTDSETRYPRSILERSPDPPFGFVRTDTSRVGRIPQQATHVANVSLGYDFRGFSGRVSALYQGSSLDGVGDRPEEDSFTDAYLRWDASLKQDVGRGLSVFLNLNNLSNTRDRSFQSVAGFLTAQELYGRTFDLGLRLSMD